MVVLATALGWTASSAGDTDRDLQRAQRKLYLASLGDYEPSPTRSGLADSAAQPRKPRGPTPRVAARPTTPARSAPADLQSEVARLGGQVAELKEAMKAQDELAGASARDSQRVQITSWLDLDFNYESRGGKPSTFDNEHVYYIFSGQVSPEWKAYSEIEFERGAELGGGGAGNGDILVEQAWANYAKSQYLAFRLGKFLTPYGIWNRNHWDPITETGREPFVFRQALIPVNQTGVSAGGSVHRGRTEIDYIAYLTNGRGKSQHADDPNANKALGFDLSVGKPRRWRLGLSGFRDRDDADANRLEEIVELWWTFDCGPWHAQAEWLRHGGDRSIDSFYIQPSYRIDRHLKLVFRYDTWDPNRDSVTDLRQSEYLVGLNHRFADGVLGKLEYLRHDDEAPGAASFNRYGSSLSILF
ncbi:MAG: hypothetical protein HY303_15895 [Candidatus Wallbacteria bacterium]|nr:hypothetical protein [Candidatus Wallbacteria bacterium]